MGDLMTLSCEDHTIFLAGDLMTLVFGKRSSFLHGCHVSLLDIKIPYLNQTFLNLSFFFYPTSAFFFPVFYSIFFKMLGRKAII